MEEPVEVRVGRGQRLTEAMREDLELYAVAELEERIEALKPKSPDVVPRLSVSVRAAPRPTRYSHAQADRAHG